MLNKSLLLGYWLYWSLTLALERPKTCDIDIIHEFVYCYSVCIYIFHPIKRCQEVHDMCKLNSAKDTHTHNGTCVRATRKEGIRIT